MINKHDYKKIVQDVIKYSKNQVSVNELNNFQIYIEDKLESFEPTLMVYGTYNAGKSTLLNALFGIEEMAKTGDSPETAEVHEYNYNGYTIYDTPGINAPIEHEKVTSEHLKKCEIILFVLSNDGSLEEEYVYKKISEIVKSNKPLLIVLNNKKGNEPDSKETIQEIDKVNINLSKIGDREGVKNIEEKVSLVIVDALTALDGKIEQEKELISESNIIQLERTIMKLLNEAGNNEVINTLNLYIHEFIDNILSKIDMKIDNPELQKTEELLTFLEKFKNKSENELNNTIYKIMNILEREIIDKLLNNSNENEINQYIEDYLDDLISEIESKFKNISNELEIRIDNFSEEINSIYIEYDKIKIDDIANSNEDGFSLLGNSLKKTLVNKEIVTNATKETLLALRDFKILFKGKWERTLSKYAGRFASVVNVLVGVYEVYQAYDSHNKEVAKQRQHTLNVKSESEKIVNSFKNDLVDSVKASLNEVFNSLIQNFREVSSTLNKDNTELIEKKNNLQKIINII